MFTLYSLNHFHLQLSLYESFILVVIPTKVEMSEKKWKLIRFLEVL